MLLKEGMELHVFGYDWEIEIIDGEDDMVKLISDRLDDDQPYWQWVEHEYLLEELEYPQNYVIKEEE